MEILLTILVKKVYKVMHVYKNEDIQKSQVSNDANC
jgi:hypothetical protein